MYDLMRLYLNLGACSIMQDKGKLSSFFLKYKHVQSLNYQATNAHKKDDNYTHDVHSHLTQRKKLYIKKHL